MTATAARSNQRVRMRKDLLAATAGLLKSGQVTTLEQVVEAALVSRATAYRHFPNIETLLVEASLDVAFRDAEELFEGAGDDPPDGLCIADAAVESPRRAGDAHDARLQRSAGRRHRRCLRPPPVPARAAHRSRARTAAPRSRPTPSTAS